MSDRPVFIYAATYGDRADALDDYEMLLDLHAVSLVGTYDVAVITKDEDGKVHVEKHEKSTQHGAWGGIAVGAVVGILFPPSVIGAAAVGGIVGAIGGHLRNGISRGDAKELGELLDGGDAALLVVGQSRVQEQLDAVLERAMRSVEKEVDADHDELARQLKDAAAE
jgi:uncharacterized membrane protein